MSPKYIKIIQNVIVSITSIVLLTSSISAFAQEGIGIVPTNQDPEKPLTKAWIMLKIKPGESVDSSVTLQNNNDTETEVLLNSKDATQTAQGAFSFKDDSEKDTLVGTWIKLSSEKVKVPGKGTLDVPLKITVPAGTAAGEYAGVVSSQTAPTGTEGGVQLVTRVGTRVYITVPGDLKADAKINSVELINPRSPDYKQFWQTSGSTSSFDDMFVNINYQNAGNIYTRLAGTITVSTPDGEVKKDFSSDLAPSSQPLMQTIPLGQKWKVGDYKVKFDYNSTPLVGLTKEGINIEETPKTVESNFNLTTDILSQMQKDRDTTPKPNLPDENAAQNPAKQSQGLAIKESSDPNINQKAESLATGKEAAPAKDMTIIYILAGVLGLAAVSLVATAVILIKKKKA